MSLADFMKQLQDQNASGIVYSQVPEQPVRVIPPEQTAVKVITPESKVINQAKPHTIKLKLERPKEQVQDTQTAQPIQQEVQPTPVTEKVEPKEEPIPQLLQQATEEELFIKSGTEDSKKAIWFDYFAQAKASRKHNPVVDRMRLGKFTITPDNKVLILPDYDVVNKDPDDILKDSWF